MNERVKGQYEAIIKTASKIACGGGVQAIKKACGGKAGFVIDTLSAATSVVVGTGIGNYISDAIFEKEKKEGVQYIEIEFVKETDNNEE